MDPQIVGLFTGLAINTAGLAVVLFRLIWGGATGHQSQLAVLERACSESVAASEGRLMAKLEQQSNNLGAVTANISDRIHQVELAAMESRAVAAETYMRRDSYHKATDEFKRDVKDAHDDLKAEMNTGFAEVKSQIDAVSMSIESGRRAAGRRGPRAR